MPAPPRALVLSAGFGTRLRPLTYFAPKPLLPVAGEPIVGHTLRALSGAGCALAVLNLHYLPEALPSYLGRSYDRMPLEYTLEPEIQGTLGALVPARAMLRPSSDSEDGLVIVVNGDSLCRWPLEQLIRRHRRSGAAATLLLLRQAPKAQLGGGVGIDKEGRVVSLRDLPPVAETSIASRHIFAGVHILEPRLLDHIEPGPGDIIADFYQPLLQSGAHVASLVTGRSWHDLGTPRRYLDANLDWSRARRWFRQGPAPVSPLAHVAASARLSTAVVGIGGRIGEQARVTDSVVLEGATIGEGARLRDCIVGPAVDIAAASQVEGQLITRFDPKHETTSGASVMGDLLFTPL